MRRFASVLALALVACATPPTPINAPLTAPRAEAPGRAPAGDDLIILALSGGGARAASFSLGVLQSLRDMPGRDGRPLSEHIALITSVSGGSILAAYYGLRGVEGLDTFREAYLDKDWRLNSFYAPTTWWRAARGGANGPARLAGWLDRELYGGARMNQLTRGPRVVINATDLANATPFAFTPLFFESVCADVARVRVADAVAASMAVPMMFRPVLARAHAERCDGRAEWTDEALQARATPELVRAAARAFRNYRQPERQRYLHLVDGGVIDNFGLTSLMVTRAAEPAPAPLTAREAVMSRRVLVMVVNAERERPIDWPRRAPAPGGYEVLYSALDAATDATKRGALDAFRAQLPEFERDLVRFRCTLPPHRARELGAAPGWACGDIALTMDVISFADLGAETHATLRNTPTMVTLPPEVIDRLIAAGRSAIERNDAIRALRSEAAASP
jgi:NTE family protein